MTESKAPPSASAPATRVPWLGAGLGAFVLGALLLLIAPLAPFALDWAKNYVSGNSFEVYTFRGSLGATALVVGLRALAGGAIGAGGVCFAWWLDRRRRF